nr:mannosyltransferase [Aldersonia kunmingensis]
MLRFAPAVLALAVIARLLWMFLVPTGFNLVDLHVYVDGSAALSDGHLYDFTYSEVTPDFPLPFTYPPFAALVFFPLHFLPMKVVGVAWSLATVAALYGVVRISLNLILGERAAQPQYRNVAMMWTAGGMWTEPVRTTLDYGQVNVFLVLGVMVAVASSRWWLSGLLVGVVAGIKLTPAVTGLYFVARRRWATVVFSAVVFGATVGLSYLVVGKQSHEYFGTLLGDASRIGPVGSVWNQSLRGAMSRLVGYDVETGAPLIAALAVLAVLALFAWRSLDGDDRLGTLIVVQLFGLMLSPISWSHHWVWIIPMAIWLLYGPYGQRLGARLVAGYWIATSLVGVVWVLSYFQDSIWPISRPGVLAWLGAVDAIGVLAFFGLLIGYRVRDNRAGTTDRKSADRSVEPATHRSR